LVGRVDAVEVVRMRQLRWWWLNVEEARVVGLGWVVGLGAWSHLWPAMAKGRSGALAV
jgi:hypothetical protein